MAHSVEVVLPAQRYVFALDEHGNAEPQAAATSAEVSSPTSGCRG